MESRGSIRTTSARLGGWEVFRCLRDGVSASGTVDGAARALFRAVDTGSGPAAAGGAKRRRCKEPRQALAAAACRGSRLLLQGCTLALVVIEPVKLSPSGEGWPETPGRLCCPSARSAQEVGWCLVKKSLPAAKKASPAGRMHVPCTSETSPKRHMHPATTRHHGAGAPGHHTPATTRPTDCQKCCSLGVFLHLKLAS